MKESFYINYFYHLRLLFSSFSTKIQAVTARVTPPAINPINKPNANILLTCLIYNLLLAKSRFYLIALNYLVKCSWCIIHIRKHTAYIKHLTRLIVKRCHFFPCVQHHIMFKRSMNVSVQVIPTIEMIFIARYWIMT